MSTAPVIRSITVDTPLDRAFAIFTDRIGDWWPLATHTPTESLAADLAFVAGALVETSPEGVRSVWGRVTEWDPPRRFAMTWSPSGGPETSIVVDFEDSQGQTRVVLRHDGWEAYGDRAQECRGSYDGAYAWGWILELFAFASDRTRDLAPVGDPAGPADPGGPYRVDGLRRGYEAVALALLDGPFGSPDLGEWNARQVAAHVTTNTELMCQVVDDVRAGRPARLFGPADHATDAIARFDGLDYDDAAGALRREAAAMVERCAALTPEDLGTAVSTYIEHHGTPIIDGDLSLADLLEAQVGFHLPAHVGQIRDLTAAVRVARL